MTGSLYSLRRDPPIPSPRGPVVLLVMDGVGVGRQDEYDAVFQARTPVLDRLSSEGLSTSIFAHGPHVGLAANSDMGNSEVGHNTMGAGRIVDQGAKRIDRAIETGAIWESAWPAVVENAKSHSGTLHLIGLLSDGNVHSNMHHLFTVISRAAADGIKKLRIHALHDGRDVPDRTAEVYVKQLEEFLADVNKAHDVDYRIASGGGRMVVTMDRYKADWRIVERGWNAHVHGAARPFASATEAIETLRAETPDISDQLLPAYAIVDSAGAPVGQMADGDSVVVFNYRGDRVIEISEAFVFGDEFAGFDRGQRPDVYFAGMTLYDGDTDFPPKRLVEPELMKGTVSEYIAGTGLRQWAGAETQKFGHMTYFWNGNRSEKFDPATETYVDISSDRVPFNQRPWMKSAQTADAVIEALGGGYEFIRANFAGGDMVGHTGDFEPTVIAVESIDLAIGRVAAAVQVAGGCLVVTADHGNAEDMVERKKDGTVILNEAGKPKYKTAHSTSKIPLIVRDYSGRKFELVEGVENPGLANLAGSLIVLLGYEVPESLYPSLVKGA